MFSGVWKPEVQLSVQTDLNSIIPSWDLSLAKTQRCSALLVDDSWRLCIHFSGSVTLHEFFWVDICCFCIKTHHLMWSRRDKYLLEVFSLNYGFRRILSVILTVPIHVIHSRAISSLLPWMIHWISSVSEHLSVLICFPKFLVKKLGKAVIPILGKRVRSREVENMTALCKDTLSMSDLEWVLHWG